MSRSNRFLDLAPFCLAGFIIAHVGKSVFEGVVHNEHETRYIQKLCIAEREMGGLIERTRNSERATGRHGRAFDAIELAEVVADRYLQEHLQQVGDGAENVDFIFDLHRARSKIASSTMLLGPACKYSFGYTPRACEFYNRTLEHSLLLVKMCEVDSRNSSDSWLYALLYAYEEYNEFWAIVEDYVAHKERYESLNQVAMERMFESVRTEILSDADPLGLHEDAPISEAARRICALVGVETFQE